MALLIDVDSNAEALAEHVQIAGRQFGFATAQALTATAYKVREAEQVEMKRAFNRPRPYTLNAFMVVPARKDAPVATVRHKEFASNNRYLETEVFGGARRKTRVEHRVGAVYGGLLDAILPADNAVIDSYGGWSNAQRNRVLSGLGAQGDRLANETAQSRKRARRTASYFIPRPDAMRPGEGLPPGVYMRQGRQLKIVLAFLTRGMPTYQPRFRFFEVARSTVATEFQRLFRTTFATLQGRDAEGRR